MRAEHGAVVDESDLHAVQVGAVAGGFDDQVVVDPGLPDQRRRPRAEDVGQGGGRFEDGVKGLAYQPRSGRGGGQQSQVVGRLAAANLLDEQVPMGLQNQSAAGHVGLDHRAGLDVDQLGHVADRGGLAQVHDVAVVAHVDFDAPQPDSLAFAQVGQRRVER